MKNILSKIRNYEIRIRKAVNGQMRGDFDSVFKGSGLEFDDIRTYQYGDDVRRIDWNTSAKGEDTYMKVFREEKEQTVFFLLDVSNSQNIGKEDQKKIDVGKEICSVLALSAVKEASEVGLICFSDQKERYIKPDKGMKKAYEIMINLFKLKPVSLKTNLLKFLSFSLELIKKRSIIILVSDFIDDGYQHTLKAMARKHDLIVIHLMDEKEIKMPKLGIVPLFDNEQQKTVWINTSSPSFRKELDDDFKQKQEELESFCRKYSANYLTVNTGEDYIPKLIKLFRVRNKKIRSV